MCPLVFSGSCGFIVFSLAWNSPDLSLAFLLILLMASLSFYRERFFSLSLPIISLGFDICAFGGTEPLFVPAGFFLRQKNGFALRASNYLRSENARRDETAGEGKNRKVQDLIFL